MRCIPFAAFLLLLLATDPLEGQEQGPSDQSLDSFGEVIDVRVLNLEVAVTDKDGRQVPDLQPQDFRLLIDGEVVPIEFLSEIREGAAQAQTEIEKISAVPSVTAGQTVGTSFLLFVEELLRSSP